MLKKKRDIDGACGNEVNKISGKTEKIRVVDKSGDKLTLNLLTTTIVAAPSNASKRQMGFNSAFEGLNVTIKVD